MSDRPGEPPAGPNHALLIGMVAGLLAVAFDVRFTDDELGRHTDALLLERPSGTWRITITPEHVEHP